MFELSLTLSKFFLFRRLVKFLLSANQRQLISLILLLVFKVLQNRVNIISILAYS